MIFNIPSAIFIPCWDEAKLQNNTILVNHYGTYTKNLKSVIGLCPLFCLTVREGTFFSSFKGPQTPSNATDQSPSTSKENLNKSFLNTYSKFFRTNIYHFLGIHLSDQLLIFV